MLCYMLFTSLISPPNNLLDVLVADLLPFRKVFPSCHCHVDIFLHVGVSKLLQFLWTKITTIGILFLPFGYLVLGPLFLVLLKTIFHPLNGEGLLVNGIAEFLAKPTTTVPIEKLCIDRLELPNEKVLVVPESLITGSNKSFPLRTPFYRSLFFLVNSIELDWHRIAEIYVVARVNHDLTKLWILRLSLRNPLMVLSFDHNTGDVRVHRSLRLSFGPRVRPGIPVPPVVLKPIEGWVFVFWWSF